ncbi:MAG: hypothetical protein JWQ78_629 [Sediminibacterium sp.]|nr:hypothetical protein [Sediminibacterium sp.]
MKKWWPLLLLLVWTGCSEKKVDLSGNTRVDLKDFTAAFRLITLPYSVSDTNIQKVADTVTIGYKAFTQFFPDSSVRPIIGNATMPVIHPVGRIEKDAENYLLVNFAGPKKTTRLAVFVTDKKGRFLASKELLSTGMDNAYRHSVSINREPTFLVSKEKTGRDNTTLFTRTGWVYNSVGIFMVVINDSNEDPARTNVINPIDTLPRKNKFSGEYSQDKKNFISLRDGKRPGMYQFFVHFEKNNGSCTGELKGEMKMKDARTAQYTSSGDPCVIDFTFEGNAVTLKEQGSCGNHRGIKCFFDDTFTRKKEPKTSKRK